MSMSVNAVCTHTPELLEPQNWTIAAAIWSGPTIRRFRPRQPSRYTINIVLPSKKDVSWGRRVLCYPLVGPLWPKLASFCNCQTQGYWPVSCKVLWAVCVMLSSCITWQKSDSIKTLTLCCEGQIIICKCWLPATIFKFQSSCLQGAKKNPPKTTPQTAFYNSHKVSPGKWSLIIDYRVTSMCCADSQPSLQSAQKWQWFCLLCPPHLLVPLLRMTGKLSIPPCFPSAWVACTASQIFINTSVGAAVSKNLAGTGWVSGAEQGPVALAALVWHPLWPLCPDSWR